MSYELAYSLGLVREWAFGIEKSHFSNLFFGLFPKASQTLVAEIDHKACPAYRCASSFKREKWLTQMENDHFVF